MKKIVLSLSLAMFASVAFANNTKTTNSSSTISSTKNVKVDPGAEGTFTSSCGTVNIMIYDHLPSQAEIEEDAAFFEENDCSPGC